MPAPSVTTHVTDLSTRVNSTGTYNSAIVVAAKKGPINTPTLVTSQTDFLRKFTPDEKLEIGWDTALYEAFQYLALQSNLYVVRAANTDETPAKFGGCSIKTFNSEQAHAPLKEGFTEVTPFDYENDAMVIYGANEGAYNNDLSVVIITDPEEVKLEGCFIIRVYKKGVKVEDWTVSLDPAMKNGYAVNCFAETALMASKYIRADVNDDEDYITESSYAVNVKGTVTFDNETIKEKAVVRRNHEYVASNVIKEAAISGVTAYYVCSKAGRTADEKPEFVLNDEYKAVVEDGTVTWTLKEIVKLYTAETDYKQGDIVTITSGSNVMNFRAMVDGTTGLEAPQWIVDNNPAISVNDGTITWANLKQVEEVSSVIGYTFKEGVQGGKLDLTRYDAYSDYYLATKLELPEQTDIEDPTCIPAEVKTMSVKYEAIYTGNSSEKHYILPKQSEKVDGAYVPTKLAGGDDGAGVTDGDRIIALKTLANLNDVNVQLIMDGGNTTPAYQKAIADVCEAREQSCHGIISVPYECALGMVTGDAQADTVNYRNKTLNANTRVLELYTTHQLIYDEFNDRNLYVSPSCFVAGAIMKTAQELGWHWAAAGYNRGVVNSLDVAVAYDPKVVDTFSDAQINTIIKENGTGNVIWDELTMLSTACDLQDAHISRWIDIYLRPTLKKALKPFLFEFNDEATRTLVVKMIDQFMKTQVAARACYDYKVVCDETNNLAADIQNNILNSWLFVKPTKLAKFIRQEIIISPQGAEFGELTF